MANIEDYFIGKRILVTGATGLVGRVLVEKVLRDLPQIGRLYVLLRPRHRGNRTISPQDRLQQELFPSVAFDRLRQQLGPGFASLIEDKVEVVSGDLSLERLGLSEEDYSRLQGEIDLVINCAAEVTFDAPLDSALQLNTLGPLRVMEFARGCRNATVAHISTCYINGTQQGPIAEEPVDPFRLASTRNGSRPSSFDIDDEVAAVVRLTERIHQQSSSLLHHLVFAFRAWAHRTHRRVAPDNGAEAETERMQRNWVERRLVAEGMRWARRRGFNDTYTLTKAMGEQLVLRHREDIPTLILRPSIIESALESPVPGWLDGMRMLDPLIVAYSRGLLPDFPGRSDAILDIVPVDMVANALLAAIPTTDLSEGPVIYQVASGMQNPLTLKSFADLVRDSYLREAQGGAQSSRSFPEISFPSARRFLRRLRYRNALPLALLSGLAFTISMTPWGRRLRSFCRSKRIGVERLAYYARLYGPYAETECQYLTNRTQQVWDALTEEERQKFNFDVGCIDWQDYIQNVHIPGLKRYVLGMTPRESRPAPVPVARRRVAAPSVGQPDPASASLESNMNGFAEGMTDLAGSPIPAGQDHDAGVNEQARETGSGSPKRSAQRSRGIIPLPDDDELDHWLQEDPVYAPVRAVLRWELEKFFRYYTGFHAEGLENVPKSGPYIVAANHSSHLDTGALMVLLSQHGRVHPLAAKDYFFRSRLGGWAFRHFVDATPFDRRSYSPESLSLALGLLNRDHCVLFFPEAGRSADGKMHQFKGGIGLLALESGAPVVPAYIRGSYQALPKGHSIPKRHPIHVHFGPPIYMEAYLHCQDKEGSLELSRKITEDIQKAVEGLS